MKLIRKAQNGPTDPFHISTKAKAIAATFGSSPPKIKGIEDPLATVVEDQQNDFYAALRESNDLLTSNGATSLFLQLQIKALPQLDLLSYSISELSEKGLQFGLALLQETQHLCGALTSESSEERGVYEKMLLAAYEQAKGRDPSQSHLPDLIAGFYFLIAQDPKLAFDHLSKVPTQSANLELNRVFEYRLFRTLSAIQLHLKGERPFTPGEADICAHNLAVLEYCAEKNKDRFFCKLQFFRACIALLDPFYLEQIPLLFHNAQASAEVTGNFLYATLCTIYPISFYEMTKNSFMIEHCVEESVHSSTQWQAWGKVYDLVQRYPIILEPRHQKIDEIRIQRKIASLDQNKDWQYLFNSISTLRKLDIPHHLLEYFKSVILEISGADTCILVLPTKLERWFSAKADRSVEVSIPPQLIKQVISTGSYFVNPKRTETLIPVFAKAEISHFLYLTAISPYTLTDRTLECLILACREWLEQILELEQRDRLNQRLRDQTKENLNQAETLVQMFHSIRQGILTFGSDYKIHRESSTYLRQLLGGADMTGQGFFELILDQSSLSSDGVAQIEAALDSSFGNAEWLVRLNSHHFPKEIKYRDILFDLDWIPLFDQQKNMERMMVVMRDVSSLRSLENQSKQKEWDLKRLEAVLSAGVSKFSAFQKNALETLDSLSGIQDRKTTLRSLHTLKGLAKVYRAEDLALTIHQIEEDLAKEVEANALGRFKQVQLKKILADYQQVLDRLIPAYHTSDELSRLTQYLIAKRPVDATQILKSYLEARRLPKDFSP